MLIAVIKAILSLFVCPAGGLFIDRGMDQVVSRCGEPDRFHYGLRLWLRLRGNSGRSRSRGYRILRRRNATYWNISRQSWPYPQTQRYHAYGQNRQYHCPEHLFLPRLRASGRCRFKGSCFIVYLFSR